MNDVRGAVAEWTAPALPRPRGPLSTALICCLTSSPDTAPTPSVADLGTLAAQALSADVPGAAVHGDDVQLSLWLCYQLHFRGLAGVDDRWEWHPAVQVVSRTLEPAFEDHLRALAAPHLPSDPVAPADVASALAEVIRHTDGPSLSSFLARRATREQYSEFLLHRSVYHLIEADAHSWAIPRLAGAPKVALVEIQSDEYGGGRPEWMHATLFADTMRDFGLDTAYGRQLDQIPAVTLIWANAMSMFGLHRRLRGAVCGHLAALEMTSSLPNRRYGNGLRRLGMTADSTTRYFDEHVEADAVHEQIAAHDLAAGLAAQEPALAADILFGAACAVLTDAAVAAHLLGSWELGASSLIEHRSGRATALTA